MVDLKRPWKRRRSDQSADGPPDAAHGPTHVARGKPPFLLKQRSSTPFIALTVGLGVLVDLAGYGLIVPVVPFRLEALGYTGIGGKTGWLVAAYAAGLIISSPPIAYFGSRFKGKRNSLIFALLFMAGALVLFMLTANYTAMVISRVLQGISGTGIWSLGLALITDSVPEERVGLVMGYVMIGFSVGSLIGPSVGGVLYERLGYKAPFVFALCLVAVDMALRLLVIEKHVALRWIEAGVEIPNFEAPGYTPANEIAEKTTPSSADIELHSTVNEQEKVTSKPAKDIASQWRGMLVLVSERRPVTLLTLTLLNGIVLGGLLDTGMTLRLNYQYGLNALGAGLVFMGAVIPSFVASPIAGWASDKYGAKGIATIGLLLSIPAYSLLIIRGPLPLFVFFLVLIGFGLSFFLTPTMQDLSVVVADTPGLHSAAAYAFFNMSYSIGALIGPIVAGQIINGLEITNGWAAMCGICSGLAAMLVLPVLLHVGGPLKSVQRRKERRKTADDHKGEMETVSGSPVVA